MQDRFVKFMLVVVAALLAANLIQYNSSQPVMQLPAIVGSAQAQSQSRSAAAAAAAEAAKVYKVNRLEGYSVEDLKEVVSVGDGRSFVVSNPKGFMVYQVVQSR